VQDVEDWTGAVDVIVGAVDRVSARLYLSQCSARSETPYVDAGCVIHGDDGVVEAMRGYVQVTVPGETACPDCLGRLDRDRARLEQMSDAEQAAMVDRGYVDGDILESEPSIIHLNAVTASIAVQQVVHLTGGAGDIPGLIRYDAVEYGVSAMQTAPTDRCPTCSHG
jgi:molybdopterin/thiamine biosynthesis adenylyltransferase